jgi:hypothetical protein
MDNTIWGWNESTPIFALLPLLTPPVQQVITLNSAASSSVSASSRWMTSWDLQRIAFVHQLT